MKVLSKIISSKISRMWWALQARRHNLFRFDMGSEKYWTVRVAELEDLYMIQSGRIITACVQNTNAEHAICCSVGQWSTNIAAFHDPTVVAFGTTEHGVAALKFDGRRWHKVDLGIFEEFQVYGSGLIVKFRSGRQFYIRPEQGEQERFILARLLISLGNGETEEEIESGMVQYTATWSVA